MQPESDRHLPVLKTLGSLLSLCASGSSAGKWVRIKCHLWALGHSLERIDVIHLVAHFCTEKPGKGQVPVCGSLRLVMDTGVRTLSPGIVLSTFSCPCSPGVAWHGSHYTSSAWLMGHFGMTKPPQANSMPPADGSLNAGTGQKARTLSSNAKTAKCAA